MESLKSLLASLVQFESVTPLDQGCQHWMIQQLESIGFQCQRFDSLPVSNFYAQYGQGRPLLIFAGHTDVVSVGDITQWKYDPFTLHQEGDLLYGRGVADMKGSLAAMLIAAKRFVESNPNPQGSLGVLITSGEEGNHFHLGTPYVMAALKENGIHPDYAIVGEPSSTERVGDVIKVGRRGSLNATLRLQGKQGHVAYPHLAENPIHRINAPLQELLSTQWDNGNDYFPPTTFQITHVHSGGDAHNIIPGEFVMTFNFRYSTEQTDARLKKAVESCFERYGLSPIIEWQLSGTPFLTASGKLLEETKRVIHEHTGALPECSTSGGTSDGRFIAPYGVEVIELGPVNATIHQVNECVSLADLVMLSDMYYSISWALLKASS